MINLFFEDVEIPGLNSEFFCSWLSDVCEQEGKVLGEVNLIFCSDEYLLDVNQKYLNHDYYTDIITFDYVKGKTISGEIFVSLQRISDNASTLSKNYEEELRRVLAHGILHLSGYKDKSEEEEKEMRRKEDFYLNKFEN